MQFRGRLGTLVIRLVRHLTFRIQEHWLRFAHPNLTLGRCVEISLFSRILLSDGGQTEIGDATHISPYAMVRNNGGRLRVGKNVFVGQGSVIAAAYDLDIGDDVLIAENVTIRDQDHGTGRGSPYRTQSPVCARTSIGRNVWLGAGVVVLKGVKIGDNAIVGAGSVVTNDISANNTAVGAPARPLRMSP